MATAAIGTEVAHRRVRRTLDTAASSLVGRRVLSMCSGGVDSIALVGLLAQLPRGAAPASVQVLWLDHGLRAGVGSERAAAAAAAAHVGVPFHERACDQDLTAMGEGLEAAARAWRYEMAIEVARELDCDVVATGHTASDQLELALLALVGVTGHAGTVDAMPVRRELVPGIDLVRPLLGLTRDDVAAFCTGAQLAWVEDPTNADPDAHTRNTVRHLVVPPLLRAHPGSGLALVRAGHRARATADGAASLADALLDAWKVNDVFDRHRLDDLVDGARAELVARWLTRAGVGRAVSAKLIDRVLELSPGQRIDLPGNACVRRDGYSLSITQAAPKDAKP